MIKKIIFYTLGLVLVTSVSCTENFDEINVNPNVDDNPPTSALLTQGMLQTSSFEYEAWRGNLIYTTLFVQQFASLQWQGDKYLYSEDYSQALWGSYYPQPVRTLTAIVDRTKDNAAEENYNSVARILKAFVFQRLTDLYGDIPYFQAGKGFIDGVMLPEYDPQQSIYNDLLKELDEAAAALDASKGAVAGDIIYGGDVAKWKKAAYSLMLRVAMRLTKADAATAQEWAVKAIDGGVFETYEETLKVAHLDVPYDNPNSHVLGFYPAARQELANDAFKFSDTFIDALKATDDPRLGILATLPDGNDDPASQVGLPNGLDPNTIPMALENYSRLRADFVQPNAPNILVSHAQTTLLVAEAIERGWVTGDAEATFRAGVKSAIDQLKLYNADAALFDNAAITAFAEGVTYPAAGTLDQKLEAIHTQYWIASLLDGYESFANWRRTGYPVLTPVDYAGNVTGGTIPRRLQYPASESGVNGENLQEAIDRQGPNAFTTRVWWDQ
jgi:hypothetical protein